MEDYIAAPVWRYLLVAVGSLLELSTGIGKLSTNLAGYVYSVLLLVVIGCGIFAVVKAQWTNLAILAGMALAGFLALFILAWVAFKAETMQEQLGDFIRS